MDKFESKSKCTTGHIRKHLHFGSEVRPPNIPLTPEGEQLCLDVIDEVGVEKLTHAIEPVVVLDRFDDLADDRFVLLRHWMLLLVC